LKKVTKNKPSSDEAQAMKDQKIYETGSNQLPTVGSAEAAMEIILTEHRGGNGDKY